MRTVKHLVFLCLLIIPNLVVISNSYDTKISSNTSANSFSTNILLSTSNSFSQHVEPTMAIGFDNQIFVGWKNANSPTSPGVGVSFTSSSDDGATWSTPIEMPSNVSADWGQSDPWLLDFNNTLYYAYLDYNNSVVNGNTPPLNHYSQVTMAISHDNGTNWQTFQASHNFYFADKETFIISPQGSIYLLYDDTASNYDYVKLSKSVDNGQTFSDLAKLNIFKNGYILAPYPALSSNNTLFVAWFDVYYIQNSYSTNYYGNIYYSYSTNGCLNFTSAHSLNSSPFLVSSSYQSIPNYESSFPVIRFDSNDRLYALWDQLNNDSQMQIFLRFSDDFGLHWSNEIVIDPNVQTNQWEPDMVIDSNNTVHIAWLEESNNQFRPYYREISFSGANHNTMSMTPIIPVADTYTSGSFTRPGDYLTIRVDSNNSPDIVWTDGRTGKLNIYFAHLLSEPTFSTNTTKPLPSFQFIIVIAIVPFYFFVRKIKKKFF